VPLTHKQRVALAGSKQIGLRFLEVLIHEAIDVLAGVVTIDDRGDARSAHEAIRARSNEAGLAFNVVTSRATQDLALDQLDADVVIVAGWYWLISKRVMAGRTFVGIHHSLLPAYRGGSPLVWAMIRGEQVVGTTLFQLDAGIDSGPVYGQAAVEVRESDTIADVAERLETAAVTLLEENLSSILSGTASPSPQDEVGASYVKQRRAENGAINWTWPAGTVHDFVRAQSEPYPGAFTFFDGQQLQVWRTALTPETSQEPPGQVVADGVVCGDGRVLALLDVQFNDERGPLDRVMSACGTGRISGGSSSRFTRFGERGP